MVKPYSSLKADNVRWNGGLDRRSILEPLPGSMFDVLENLYVSSDGTEIRRIPGWNKVATPQFRESLGAPTVTIGLDTRLAFGSAHFLNVGDAVQIEGNTTTPSINGEHLVKTWVDALTIDIELDTSTGAGANDGIGYAERAKHVHRVRQCLDRLVVVGEDKHTESLVAVQVLDAIEAGNPNSTWFFSEPHGYDVGDTFSVDINTAIVNWAGLVPIIPVAIYTATAISPYAATVPFVITTGAFRPAVAGDRQTVRFRINNIAAWVHHSLPALGSVQTGHQWWKASALRNWAPPAGPVFTRDMSYIYRKSEVDVATERVLIASPGYGCCFQANIRAYDLAIAEGFSAGLQEVMTLGMPRGLLDWENTVITIPAGTVNVTDSYVAVAYINRWTGEIGRMSEARHVGAVVNKDIEIVYTVPWLALRECATDSMVAIFLGPSPTSLFLHLIVSPAFTLTHNNLGVHTVTYTGAALPTRVFRALNIEQLPPGVKTLRTVRGFTLFGGIHATEGASRTHDRFTNQIGAGLTLPDLPDPFFQLTRTTQMVGGAVLPASYEGSELFGRTSVAAGEQRFRRLLSNHSITAAATAPRGIFHNWETDGDSGAVATESNAWVTAFKGHAWSSEQGFPGVAPGENRIIVDRILGKDVEAIGRIADTYVVATDRETYTLTFGRSPLGSEPRLVTDQYGAISPMVEFDNGVAWISHRGPVLFTRGGGFEWIGEPVLSIFDDALRDSKGMMPHSVLGWDPNERLLFFGMRTDKFNTEYADVVGDDTKSKVGCDFFLVYSVGAHSWSTWQPPANISNILDMWPLVYADGQTRLSFLAKDPAKAGNFDTAVYAFDPTYFDSVLLAGIVSGTVNSANVGPQTFFESTGAIGTGTATEVGMQFYITAADGTTLRAIGQVFSIDSATRVSLAEIDTGALDSVTLVAGDIIHIGVIHSRLDTRFEPPMNDWSGRTSLKSWQFRHDNPIQPMWAQGTAIGEIRNSIFAGIDFSFVRMDDSPTGKGGNRTRLQAGQLAEKEVRVHTRFIGRARLRLKDLLLERESR